MAFIMSMMFGILLLCPVTGYAAMYWPTTELTAEAGIVMDVDTGAVLFSKNPNVKEYPASITKVLTALVVLEHCNLDEMVTFSHDDVYNVDIGSSNAGIDEGDVLSVRDCLHALLLKSANEAANGLACHVAGSREAFAKMMNEKAISLGAKNSHFENPSGLFSENHYTTAYDMALIGAEAMKNKDFLAIESDLSYKIGSTKRNPDGYTCYMEHKMLRKDTQYSDARVIAGKTGYTKDAGNTLITMAREDGRNLVAVVLKDKNPAHYVDTKALLDLGFTRTENQPVDSTLVDVEKLRDRLVADTIVSENCEAKDLTLAKDMIITVPTGSDQSGVSYQLNYNLPEGISEQAIAEIQYLAEDGRTIGRYLIEKEPSVEVKVNEVPTEAKVAVAVSVSAVTIGGIIAFFVFGSGTLIGLKNVHDERKLNRRMRERRKQRLQDMDISEEEFRELVEKRRTQKHN